MALKFYVNFRADFKKLGFSVTAQQKTKQGILGSSLLYVEFFFNSSTFLFAFFYVPYKYFFIISNYNKLELGYNKKHLV